MFFLTSVLKNVGKIPFLKELQMQENLYANITVYKMYYFTVDGLLSSTLMTVAEMQALLKWIPYLNIFFIKISLVFLFALDASFRYNSTNYRLLLALKCSKSTSVSYRYSVPIVLYHCNNLQDNAITSLVSFL